MDLGLQGKVVLVTGASKGIGRAIAEEFVKEGAHVSICARGPYDLGNTAEALRTHGALVVATPADVTKADDVRRVIDTTITQCGHVDILVNNAGDAWLGHTIETPDDQWRYALDVNLQSAVRFTRGVVSTMRQQGGGRIINIASVFGHTIPLAGTVDYNAAKAALLAFSRTMAIELAPDNILVNAVCPGFTYSPLHEHIIESAMTLMGLRSREEVYQVFQQFLCIKRIGQPEEVAAVVVFLASKRASYITGSVYDVDGGFIKSV